MTVPDISFIVPTYGEAENLPLLVQHIKKGLGHTALSWELIIANDESADNTVAVCEQLARTDPVRLLNRTANRGLALAVIDGVKLAKGTYLVVMDADMSHPASLVPDMVARLRDGQADFVIGSRNVQTASTDEKWPVLRHVGTFCATALVRPLVNVRDPMAGFFALRHTAWPTTPLHPIGYKIGLEIIVRAGLAADRVLELPIHFTDRKFGESKMGLRELHNYLRHVLRLYRFRWPLMRLFLHCGVGAVGLVVDICVYLGLQLAGVPHLGARLLSYWPATVCNWWLNRMYTYDDRPLRNKALQLAEFVPVTLLGFLANATTYYLLTAHLKWFGNHHLTALVTGAAAGLLVNYTGSNLRVYGKDKGQDRPKSSS